MSFEKVLFCFALVGSAGFCLVLAAALVFWSKLKIQSLVRSDSSESKGKDETLDRALKLLEDQTMTIETLKDTTATLLQRLEAAEAAFASKPAVEAPEQSAAPAASPVKPTRRRSTKTATVAPADGGIAAVGLPTLEELSMVGGMPMGMPVDPSMGSPVYHGGPSELTLGQEKFEVIA
ncbi:hypothetical protein [Acidovorax delafieldii]|uniref:hypothetical protein n=1 Tax=Acidovorax delafieldii TaxID=47920 RepID=UPI003ECD42C3